MVSSLLHALLSALSVWLTLHGDQTDFSCFMRRIPLSFSCRPLFRDIVTSTWCSSMVSAPAVLPLAFQTYVALTRSTDNALLCVPPKHIELKNRYLLARSAIIRHLKHHLPGSHDGLEIHTFASVQGPDFGDYLGSASVYFIMCHDGAEASQTGKGSLPPTNATHAEAQKRGFRGLIRHFILQGYDVALVNNLDVRDSKVSPWFFNAVVSGIVLTMAPFTQGHCHGGGGKT